MWLKYDLIHEHIVGGIDSRAVDILSWWAIRLRETKRLVLANRAVPRINGDIRRLSFYEDRIQNLFKCNFTTITVI